MYRSAKSSLWLGVSTQEPVWIWEKRIYFYEYKRISKKMGLICIHIVNTAQDYGHGDDAGNSY
ncbi:UNVERIFIED_CONTAM: hypothetical protein NCL1_17838 [Trichonephila clavipes]